MPIKKLKKGDSLKALPKNQKIEMSISRLNGDLFKITKLEYSENFYLYKVINNEFVYLSIDTNPLNFNKLIYGK